MRLIVEHGNITMTALQRIQEQENIALELEEQRAAEQVRKAKFTGLTQNSQVDPAV